MPWRRLLCALSLGHKDPVELGRDNIRKRRGQQQHLSHCRFCDKIYWRAYREGLGNTR